MRKRPPKPQELPDSDEPAEEERPEDQDTDEEGVYRPRSRSRRPDKLRGGKIGVRDKWPGITDAAFKDWWHRVGQKRWGKDYIKDRASAKEVYDAWEAEGRPNAPKGTRR